MTVQAKQQHSLAGSDSGVQSVSRGITGKIDFEYQSSVLNFALVFFASALLVFSIYGYWLGSVGFAATLMVNGGTAIALLVFYQQSVGQYIKLLQWLFVLLLLTDMHLFLFAWANSGAGMLAAVCLIPLLVAVLELRWSINVLIGNFFILNIVHMTAIFPNSNAISVSGLWHVFLCAYVMLSLLSLVLEFFRLRNSRQLIEAVNNVKPAATLDELSGLPNRREMERHLGACLNRYYLTKEPFSVISGNIDDFKQCNEEYGHKFGDSLIRDVARVLQRGLRSDDVVARWGGDDFLILLPHQQPAAARQVAERLRSSVAAIKKMAGDDEYQLSISFGVACIDGHENCDELLAAADRGLYQAKNMGKGLVVAG